MPSDIMRVGSRFPKMKEKDPQSGIITKHKTQPKNAKETNHQSKFIQQRTTKRSIVIKHRNTRCAQISAQYNFQMTYLV